MHKKGILAAVLVCILSMTGCISINTGKDNDDTKQNDQNNNQNEVKREVIIQHENDKPSSNYSSNNASNSNQNNSKSYDVSDYIFYDSDTRYLTSSDLQGLSSWELKLARNEIYARKGRLFNDSALQNHFNSCSWYNGYISPNNFNDNSLNKVERYNISLIKKFE